MKRNIILAIAIIFIMAICAGCIGEEIKDINDEVIETFEVIKSEEMDDSSVSDTSETNAVMMDEKFVLIDFYLVAGVYSRNVAQEDVEILEMFAQDRNNFLRVAEDDLEQEVYAYNYVSDDFTYLYYFDGELVSKTVINVETGAVIKDDAGYASLLSEDAKQLKDYFYELIDLAGITLAELEG